MGGRFFPPALLGAAMVLVGLLLPWIRAEGLGSANAFDLPVGSLFNSSKPDAVNLGVPLLILAAVVALPLQSMVRAVAAVVIFVAVGLFVFQLQRTAIELTSILGLGVLVTAFGAVVAFPWKRRSASANDEGPR